MATKQELQENLEKLKKSLDAVPEEFKADIQNEITAIESEIATLEATNEPKTDDGFIKSLLSTIAATMESGSGTGVDTPQVRKIIKEYLRDDKVGIDELDKSVLDEIKKNQAIVLEIPAFSKKIELNQKTSKIPNFYEIIDDVLAGNNVYLIGEAGGGKTYTAEQVAIALQREYVTLNCSQYTSPLEILGGQSVDGYKEGKLIDCWRNGKILILDEMPKLDSNTAGLFNDALAKSTKTRPNENAKINSTNAQEPPIVRNTNFAVIATGNIYPNEPPAPQYRGNNQQDLSLLDRFSGSVYYTEFDNATDQDTTRFKFLYDFLVGNYYEYISKKAKNEKLPTPIGLRTWIEELGFKNLALVSYRTNISFRVGFEYELVRAIARRENKNVEMLGKTLLKTFKSYMVAFRSNRATYDTLIDKTKYTDDYIMKMTKRAIDEILDGEEGFLNSLNDSVKSYAKDTFKRYSDFYVSEPIVK